MFLILFNPVILSNIFLSDRVNRCVVYSWWRIGISPELLESSRREAAAKSDDGVGALKRPEHAGLFEPAANDVPAAGLDNA